MLGVERGGMKYQQHFQCVAGAQKWGLVFSLLPSASLMGWCVQVSV